MTDSNGPGQDQREEEERADTDLESSPDPAPEEADEPQIPEGEAETGEPPAAGENFSEEVAQEDPGRGEGVEERQEADLAAEDEFLEEMFYPSSVSETQLEVGSEYSWAAVAFTVEEALPKGWYRARRQETLELLLVQPQPWHEVWSRLPKHPLLPRVLHNGPEGFAVAYTEGEAVEPPLALEQALDYVFALAQLVRFFEVQEQAVVYIDPDGLLLTDSGACLRFPPRLAPIGAPLPNFYREGYTAPEVQAGATATGKEGVYVLAALLLQFLAGESPPPEGASLLMLSDIRTPGLPQLLFTALTTDSERMEPEAFVRAVKALRGQNGLEKPTFQVGAATTVGLNPERPVNQDSYGYIYDVVESYAGLSSLFRAVVSDGMGGEAAGELASRAAVETFCRETPSRPLDSAQAQTEWTLQLAWSANNAVLEALSGQSGGCTLTGIVMIGNRLSLAHVGDTRAYIANAQEFARLTKDHSLVDALLANGVITEAEAQSSPDRNKILRSLGSIRQYQANYVDSLELMRSTQTMALEAGDTVVLVSDGVWGEVNDTGIQAMAEQYADDPQALAEALIDEALKAGAPDNAAALVVKRIR